GVFWAPGVCPPARSGRRWSTPPPKKRINCAWTPPRRAWSSDTGKTRMSQAHAELEPPPPLADGALRVIPMGGLGAIGRNMAALEFDGKLLVIDCGVLFPDVEQP